jgi:alpha-tubulin suppressor-like RCC1 family protein
MKSSMKFNLLLLAIPLAAFLLSSCYEPVQSGGGGSGGLVTATLSELSLEGASLDQTFQEDQLNYTASVEFSTSQVNLTVRQSIDSDTVTVNGSAVTGGPLILDLNVGGNAFTITVSNDFASQAYTLTITRAAAPPVIGGASITNIDSRPNEVTLSWSDAPNATSYNIYYFSTNDLNPLASLDDYINQPEGTRIANQTSPVIINGLTNNTSYQFYVSAVESDGNEIVDLNDIQIAVPRPDLGEIKIATGESHSLAIRSDGSVIGWGRNNRGQIGGAFTSDTFSDVNLSNVVAVTAGQFHSVALLSNGTVMAWGSNVNGKLGNGSTTLISTPNPVVVNNLTDVISIAAGWEHTLALKSDGTVLSWGENDNGELGDGTQTNRNQPVFVTGISDVIAIDGGAFHSIALKSDGTVWTWGLNHEGQLGDGSNAQSLVPIQVSGLSDITAIAAGSSHNMALDSSGRLFTWGFNGNGEVGNLTRTNVVTPQQVNVPGPVVRISAGYVNSFALTGPGVSGPTETWYYWGSNAEGQLGLSSITTPRLLGPTAANLFGSNTFRVVGGFSHTILLNWDGEIRGYGQDDEGQLDFGVSSSEPTPESRSISLVVP